MGHLGDPNVMVDVKLYSAAQLTHSIINDNYTNSSLTRTTPIYTRKLIFLLEAEHACTCKQV